MNYLAIVLMIAILVLILPNKKIYKISEIKKMNAFNIESEIQGLKNSCVIYTCGRSITEEEKRLIFANYIYAGKKPMAIDFKYIYKLEKGKLWSGILKKILAISINYVEIFKYKDGTSSDIVVGNSNKVRYINFFPSNELTLKLNDVGYDYLFEKMKSYKFSIKNATVVLVTIVASAVIWTNLLYYVLNYNADMFDTICAIIIYLCYSYINKSIYKAVGKVKMLSTYLFPIYLIVYLVYNVFIKIKRKDKRKKKSMRKKGISLIVLVITIIVLSIISTVSIISISDSLSTAKLVAFAEDITTIQGAVEKYVVETGTLPYTGNAISASSLRIIAGANSQKLSEELTENGDTESQFYKVDMAKIGITSSTRGLGTSGTNDTYYVNEQGTKVYYPLGLKISNEVYFSITSKLSNVTTIVVTETESGITINGTTEAITIRKNSNLWTNELKFTATTVLQTGETLKYAVGDSTEEHTVISGTTNTLSLSTFSANDLAGFNESKTVTVKKYSSSNSVIAQSIINISNLDITVPTLSGVTLDYIATDYNVVRFTNILDTDSGIKELRYEFVEKYDNLNNIVNYYNVVPTITEEYLASMGKIAHEVIKVPKNIHQLAVVAVDNAGNISTITTVVIPANIAT